MNCISVFIGRSHFYEQNTFKCLTMLSNNVIDIINFEKVVYYNMFFNEDRINTLIFRQLIKVPYMFDSNVS